MRHFVPLVVPSVLAVSAACGPDYVYVPTPIMSVTLHGDTEIGDGDVVTLAVGDRAAAFEVRNTGPGDLLVYGAALTCEDNQASLWTQGTPTAQAPIALPAHADLAWSIRVSFSGGPTGGCRLTLETNPAEAKDTRFEVDVLLQPGAPLLGLPVLVDLGTVHLGEEGKQELQLTNAGSASLTIDHVELTGHPGFRAETAGQRALAPTVVPPGSAATWWVAFTPSDTQQAKAELLVFSDDPATGDAGALVLLRANSGGPCLSVNPASVSFGGKFVGSTSTVSVELTSCGTESLTVGSLELTETTPDVFGLTVPALPLLLAPGETHVIEVTYTPTEVAPVLGSGVHPDLGTLAVTDDSLAGSRAIALSGYGVSAENPIPVIKVKEGDEVDPQTTLHLIGSQSYAPQGAVAKWEWEVERPAGSQDVFVRSAFAADPVFETNVVGVYTFRLHVWDELGQKSLVPAERQVFVFPKEAIHVELTWTTPNDPDESDTGSEAGSDLDLHFLHPFATGLDVTGDGTLDGWFDFSFDCFFWNQTPVWGAAGSATDDDPRLDRDDTNGGGPENLNLHDAESGATYRIGVHYWEDWGWGSAYPTLRIYLFGVLKFEAAGPELVEDDLWEVATIAWPSGEIAAIDAPLLPGVQILH